ncbi:hypothetical protein V5O48_016998 [Marasmius crinis-equi]|uniref:Uncharacterized protein n=1 Tax=Marasmius crinis-equi TaxID=585013 RepID=A0ABR3EQ72_9AGAR
MSLILKVFSARSPARKRRSSVPFDPAKYWNRPGLMDAFMNKDRDSPDPPSSPMTLSDIIPTPPSEPIPVPSFTLRTPATFDRRSHTSSSISPPSSIESTRIPQSHDTPTHLPSLNLSPSIPDDLSSNRYVRRMSLPGSYLQYPASVSHYKRPEKPGPAHAQQETGIEAEKTVAPVKKSASDPSVASSSIRVIRSPTFANSEDHDQIRSIEDESTTNGKARKRKAPRTKATKTEGEQQNGDVEPKLKRQRKRKTPALKEEPTV